MPPKKAGRKPVDSFDEEVPKKLIAASKPKPKPESESESSDSEDDRTRRRGFKGFAQISSSESDSEASEDESSSSSDSSSESSESEDEKVSPVPAAAPPAPPAPPAPKAKAKGKAKPKNKEADNIDDLLAEIEAPSKPMPKAASKKPAAKQRVTPIEDDDLDALLAEVLPPPPVLPAASVSAPNVAPLPKAEDEDEDEDKDGGEKEISSKTLKNRLKKQKKKQAATETKEEGSVAAPKAKAKAAPKSAAILLAQKRLQAVQEAERLREEEERRVKEEEARLEAEEKERVRIEEEERERKRLAKQEKKERQRKEGKPMTAAAKEKARKVEQARQQLLEGFGGALPDAQMKEKKTKSRVVDDKKKKKKAQKIEESPQPEAIQPESPVVEKVETPQQPVVEEHVNWEDWLDDVPSVTTAAGESEIKDQEKIPHKNAESEIKVKAKIPKKKVESGSEDSSEDSSSEDEKPVKRKPQPKKPAAPVLSKEELQQAKLRSPICCILGHVDTGKTKLLDKIRHTNVQSNEAGGITQQIGATFFPQYALWEQCKKIEPQLEMRVPGLLIIDTPGHESFNNLRARGSSLCDIAILVVDIMHGLEPQTRESLGLLRARKCPFVVALNKIDRLYAWAAMEWAPARQSLEKQQDSTQDEFKRRANDAILQLAEEGLNCSIWWTVEDVRKIVSVAPTSAITGEGIPDLLLLLVKLTQTVITKALVFRQEFQCTILEVKTIEGLGTTIDVVLVSGTLYENEKIVVCGMSGPIVTTIRALLTPQPMKELRVKGEYIHHKEIHAAMGVKISAQGLEDAVAGTSLFVARNCDEDGLEVLREDVMADMASIFKSVDRSGVGVYVMASTLGSLEALLQFLSDSKISVFAVNLGTVHKLDVKKAAVMREKGRPDLSCILAFDIKVEPDAVKEAQSMGVKIFTADIIYHLFDSFTKYVEEVKEAKRRELQNEAVFPCILTILPNCAFNKKDPIVLGVKIDEGILKVNTPICVPDRGKLLLGRVASLEHNKKPVDKAKKGDEVSMKITGDSSIAFGRHFDETTKLYSRLTRDSIDCLKEYFRDELSKDDWKTVVTIKKVLDIV